MNPLNICLSCNETVFILVTFSHSKFKYSNRILIKIDSRIRIEKLVDFRGKNFIKSILNENRNNRVMEIN